MDNELSVRAGLNIGIEPTLLPFVQAGTGNVIPINPSGDTLIAEHTDQAARVFFQAEQIIGYLWNPTPEPGSTTVRFVFKDELGNEISLNVIDVSLPGPTPIELGNDAWGFACLAAGEQVVARISITAPPPS